MSEALPVDGNVHREGFCSFCDKPSATLYYQDRMWVCRHCRGSEISELPNLKVLGSENPFDPKGSTAHVKDIKDRRWHPTEKRLFYWSKEKPKTYYFPKG